VLGCGKPVAHEVLAHAQAQTAYDDETEPPIVENDGAGNHGLVVAVPINHQRQDQR